MDITLSDKKFADIFLDALEKFGADEVPVGAEQEGRSVPDYLMMSVEEIENRVEAGESIVLKVDDGVLDRAQEAVDQFLDCQKWYEQFNDTMRGVLGDDSGRFFLATMAALSANARLAENFYNAVKLYLMAQKDIKENSQLLKRFLNTFDYNEKNLQDRVVSAIKQNEEFQQLTIADVIEGTLTSRVENWIRILRFYANNGYAFDVDEFLEVMAASFDAAGRIQNVDTTVIEGDKVIGAQKVFNFSLNLIAPGEEIGDIGWMPVTIDTHMISFFYPHMDKDEKNDVLKKYKKYSYLAKYVHKLADKINSNLSGVNLEPHQLQAILWSYRISQSGGDPYTNMEHALKETVRKIEERQELLENMTNLVKKIQQKLV